jgi:hypothetical protein
MKANRKHQTLKDRLIKYLLPNLGALIILPLFILAQQVGAAPWRAPAAVPSSTTTVNYQGRLFDNSGDPVNGNVTLVFSLYDQASGGNRKWGPETHTGVPVSDGLFSVLLGSRTVDGIPQSALGGDLWLEVSVNGETLSPREQLGAVPYAIWSLNGADNSGVPVGTVVSWWRPDAGLPIPSDGWAIADGSVVSDPGSPLYGQPLPDLTGRFIMGVTPDSIGQMGGSNTLDLSHSHQVNSHTHSIPSHSHNLDHDHHTSDVYCIGGGSTSVHRDITGVTVSNTGSWSGTTGASQPSTNSQLSSTTDNRPQYVGLLFLVRIK